MAERYFAGFEFKKFEPVKPFIITVPSERTETPSIPIRVVHVIDLVGSLNGPTVEPEPDLWASNQLQREFVTQLDQIDRQIRYPRLTMHRRTMTFVTTDEMLPQTDEERQQLIQKYGGDYIADGGAGDCRRNPDGTFTMRIGFAGQEDTASKDEIFEVMGHEYGHTLGVTLEDPIFEELKAYTFANLLMKHYYDVDEYCVTQMDVSTVHDTAQFWLEQLLEKGISEEAILAHLTGRKFGKSYPKDYLK